LGAAFKNIIKKNQRLSTTANMKLEMLRAEAIDQYKTINSSFTEIASLHEESWQREALRLNASAR